jgi:ATP-dependent DNA helicase RecQ
MCYQLPGLMLPGLTVVVSPLISLMRDQVQALAAAGIPAAYLNSTLTGTQARQVYRNLHEGRYKILYVAPERLDGEGFLGLAEKVNISFIAVDEAHCISQWGQDFRPSYLRIVQFIESLPRRPVVGAYTATATKQVREDITRILKLNKPVSRITGFDRPNLYFEVLRPDSKDGELLRLLASRKRKSGIIYCSTRNNVEVVCRMLIENGYKATRYHAGLDESERSANQEDFLYDRKPVMVATNAFGMGIDKSNVSYVIHYNMPRSIESYYQEAGRAGRDGSEADCILLFANRDVNTARFMIRNGSDNDALTPAQREIVRRQDFERLDAIVGYCKTEGCLRAYLLEYFGQKSPQVCGNCGSCLGDYEKHDITREAQMILSCVKRIYDRTGSFGDITILARTLRGSRDRRILELGLDELTTYGLLKDRTRSQIHEMIDHLESLRYLREGQDKTLELTEKAKEVLYRGQTVTMLLRKEQEQIEEMEMGKSGQKLSDDETELYDMLKELRSSLAKENRVPPFVIFSNATLADMARKKPVNLTDFKKVSGVGEIKASWYGKDFLSTIKKFMEK